MGFRFSFEVHKFESALTPYETIETRRPSLSNLTYADFTTGTHFRTATSNGSLILQLEDRLLTIILDESGSMTWNDSNGDRYVYLRRLLEKLRDTYPGSIKANLLGFGGVPVKTKLLVTQASGDFLADESNQQLNNLLQQTFQDSSHDFAGVRVVRRTDRFPSHPADGVVLEEGILDAVKDDSLTEGQIYYYGVWTFNKNLHFSTGQFISGTPRDRILPYGVNFASSSVRVLPGTQRQSNLEFLYNFVEGSGSTVFDSSGNGNHAVLGSQVIEDNFWLGDSAAGSVEDGDLKKTVGVRFDGEFDILEASAPDSIAIVSDPGNSQSITVNFWVYRYENSSEEWVIGTSNGTSNEVGWAIGIEPNGSISGTFNASVEIGFSTNFSSSVVPVELWTMVTFVIEIDSGNVTRAVYINGALTDSKTNLGTPDTRDKNSLYTGAKPTDSGNTWNGTDFFGALNNISIHSVIRDADYIADLFVVESPIFNQPLQGSAERPQDNTQREVLLSWEVENDFNYEGGQIRIIRKYREIPSHQNDGDLVLLQSAEAGQFFYLDSFDFVNNQDYHYRIFTINSLGNPCDRVDARVLSVHIPSTPALTIEATLSPVTNLIVTNGNQKVMLEWDNPSDSNFRGTRIYFGAEQFPTISVGQQGKLEISNGFELFDSPTTEFFVHRKTGITSSGVDISLINATYHFYTIITYDQLGHLSQADFATGIPSSQLATIFPPEEVKDVHIEIVNPVTLSIQWKSPLVKSEKLELFFGESALLFVNIRDIFGGNLEDLVNISLKVCTKIIDRDLTAREKALGVLGAGDALDGPCGGGANSVPMINGGCEHGSRFDENCNDEREESETVLKFSVVESGLIKGLLAHTLDAAILTRRDRYEMDVRAQYRVINPDNNEILFELNTEPVQVSFQHPLQMSLINKQNRKVEIPCGQTGEIRGNTICEGCDSDTEGQSCTPSIVNGTHINSTQPYVVRAEFQYKGESLPDGTFVSVSLFKNTENPLITKSTRTSIREGAYTTSAIQEPLLTPSGNPTGDIVSKSIVDIEILAPSLADKVDLHVSINYLGFIVDSIHSVQFVGSLFIALSPGKPRADGIDIAEQFVLAEQIDPDDPLTRVPVPDGTLIKWELVRLRFAKDRPFYSEEPINELISGVFSTTTGGIARNVFFGPIGHIQSHDVEACNELCCLGEEYAIRASVILGEETATDAAYIAFSCQEEDETFVNRRFFFNAAAGQIGQKPNYITWGDGISLIKFQIAKNPNSITEEQIPGAICFRACAANFSGPLISFAEEQIVQITAAGDILWNVEFGGIIDTADVIEYTSEVSPNNNDASFSRYVTFNDPQNVWDDSPTVLSLGHWNLSGVEINIDAYLRLQVNVPTGENIQSAKIVFTPDVYTPTGSPADINIEILETAGVENINLNDANASTFRELNKITGTSAVRWQPDGTLASNKWIADVASEESTTPDLTELLQTFVDRGTYSPGDYAVFYLSDRKLDGSANSQIQAQSGNQGRPPKLIIESAPSLEAATNITSSNSATPADGENTVTAPIPIQGDVTEFYIRNNIFIGEENNPQPEQCSSSGGGGAGGSGESLLSCEWRNDCFPYSDFCVPVQGTKWTNVSPVKGSSTILFNNIPNVLSGGGGYTEGMPPIMIGFKEPLAVNLLETRVNGVRQQAQELDVSGTAQHTFVIEVTFGADENNILRPVPDGTPVELNVSGPNSELVSLSNCSEGLPGCSLSQGGIIYTNKVNDPFINPSGAKRSLAYFSIRPLPNVPFNAKINVTCRYDQLGTVERVITKCIELNNTINAPIVEPPPQGVTPEPPAPATVTSNEAIVYDTVNDLYSTVAGGQINRISHFSAGVPVPVSDPYEYGYQTGPTNKIFLFGGFTDHDINGFAQISATSEIYDVLRNEWTFITDMPTARAAGMTVIANNVIYCIGGLELNPITQQFVVSRKIELYDTTTGMWNPSLSSMPEDYGVAFGDAQYDGSDNIYVLCGLNSVINNNQPDVLNDRILRYTISNDTWTKIRPLDLPLYKRIAPFGFYRDNPLPLIAVTENIAVESGSSDANASDPPGTPWSTTGELLLVGHFGRHHHGFFRFPLNLEANSTILSANISAVASTGRADIVLANIFLLDFDNTPLFEDSNDLSGTATIGSGILWDMTDDFTSIGGTYTSPDIAPIIRSFIDRSGYSPGNYIGIKFDTSNTADDNFKLLQAYESSSPRAAILNITYMATDSSLQTGYIYSGSLPKTLAEINAEFNQALNHSLDDFRSFILTSPYYLSLTSSEQNSFITTEEEKIVNSIIVPPYIYLASGFKYTMGSEHVDGSNDLIIDISDKIDDEWAVLPKVRDRGRAVYISSQDAVYFMGGSNQNKSTTLNRVEVIDLTNEANTYSRLTPFSRGRALFGAVKILDDIYLSGGLTSGHSQGYVEIDVIQGPQLVEARGSQSSGVVIFLRDDSGELITNDIRCIVRGRLRINALDNILADFLAGRAADRALGGDGSGNAPDAPQPGDEIDVGKLIAAQNSIIDPNSDQFQFNSSKKLGEQVFLFPVLYSEQEITISGGVGGVSLLPRSEDPLSNLQKLAEFIKQSASETPTDTNERFEGDLTKEELLALGDALKTVELPPTILDSNATRNLYEIETIITIVDDFYFGQTVSDFDIDIQEQINSRIETILTPPPPPDEEDEDSDETDSSSETIFRGMPVTKSDCFLVQHLATSEIPQGDQPPPPVRSGPNNPGGTGGFNQSGQCLFCNALLPLNPSTRPQLPTSSAIFFNSIDWVPQLKQRLTSGNTLSEVLQELDTIDHEVPFGASQLYSSMKQAAIATTGDAFEATKKVFYIVSDNAENYSLISRDAAIAEINAVDGDRNAPVVYTLFSTSFPVTIAAELQRSEVGDIEKITKATGGQSSTLISSGFLDQILNLTIGGATGGLGWGKYSRIVQLSELSAITSVVTDFDLPLNTQGFLRFRYSADGFNFTDWTERFANSQNVDFVDFFAKIIEFEIVLTTGFTTEISEEYDATATGIPRLISITWGTSGEREDFIFLNKEDILTNVQQLAASFEGDIPPSSTVEIGVASSNSHDWRDFQSSARPAIGEFGKTLLLERTDDPFSLVPVEPLVTRDGLLFKTNYGSWDPLSNISLVRVTSTGEEIPVLIGFTLHPRNGEIYFNQRQPLDSVFKLAITNPSEVRVGLRLRNRLHTDSISIQGVGYIYSTNNIKPVELSQVAPTAVNVSIVPTNPTTQDTIFATYDYRDLNGDPETGTVISWFKNNTQLLEIQNITSWSTSDLNLNNQLGPSDRLLFSVTPSDGRDFGTTLYSPSVTIVAQPPAAEGLTVISTRGGIGNPRFDTASDFSVQYTFEIEDTGPQSQENGTEIKWLVGGQTFKVGKFPFAEGVIDPRKLAPTETGDTGTPLTGQSAHVIGNEISVQVTPKTLLITGATIISSPFIVANSIPIASNVVVLPATPTAGGGGQGGSTLQVSYDLDDPDIAAEEGTQTDQSEIEWFNTLPDGVDFFPSNADTLNSETVSPVYLTPGQQWKARITPFDTLDTGIPVFSNIVIILPP